MTFSIEIGVLNPIPSPNNPLWPTTKCFLCAWFTVSVPRIIFYDEFVPISLSNMLNYNPLSMPTKTPRELDNQEYKRQVMWLLLLPPERREEEVSALLDLLKVK